MSDLDGYVADRSEAIASVFPLDLSGQVVALRACIDASTRESGVFTIAGVAYGFNRALKANRRWVSILDGRPFHMADLHARVKDFAGASDEEVHRIMLGTVDTIHQYASYFFAVSCDAELVKNDLPTASSPDADSRAMLAAFRSVYGFMCHMGMYVLGGLADSTGRQRQISYIFERGDSGQRGLCRYLDHVQSLDYAAPFLDGYSLNRYSVTGKDEMEGIFHSADLVAWEWAKHVDRQRGGHKMRPSLAAMMGGEVDARHDVRGMTVANGTNFFFRHFDAERLKGSISYFSDTLVATSHAEVDAAFNRWAATR